MRNPWLDLPRQPPYVLPEDADAIDRFNRATATRRAADRTRLHLDLLPEPFLGDPAAPVVLLSLNSGYSPDAPPWHLDPTFAARSRGNLEHRPADYPFYLLDPALDAPGSRWWARRLGPLIAATSRQVVANRVLCVEYFGYHSVGFGHERLRVPSQDYGSHLVRQALARDAAVVLTRSRRLWVDAVPELASYPHLFTLRSVQNTTVSQRNCPDGFDAILEALSTSQPHEAPDR